MSDQHEVISADLPYFHGCITRAEAESTLKTVPSGTFLIRARSQSPGQYVLSMMFRKQFMHFQLHNHGECWFSIDDGPLFEGLDEMIGHYTTLADGLPTVLGQLCPRPPINTIKASTTSLHSACLKGQLDKIRSCKAPGMINSLDKYGRTPLHETCRAGNLIAATELMSLANKTKSRIDLAVRDNQGWSALHYAAASGNGDLVRQLSVWGAPINSLNNDSETPRHIAARFGATDCCHLLTALEKGASTADLESVKWPWYHGQISRVAAEHILTMNGISDGLFLVRKSSSSGHGFVLTVSYMNNSFHYQITAQNATGSTIYCIDDGPTFRSLQTLLDYYASQPDGLPCPLQRYCRKKSMQAEEDMYQPALYASMADVRQAQAASSSGDPTYEAPSEPGAPRVPPRSSKPVAPPPGGEDVSSDDDADDYTHMADALPIPGIPGKSAKDAPVIPASQLKETNRLGSGEFGDVMKGTWVSTEGTREVAIKKLKNAQQHEQEFLREATIMAELQHTNVVQLYGVCKNPRMMIMEFVALGAMEDYLLNNYAAKKRVPDSNQCIKWAQQVAAGMLYLEKKRFVHRDLATRNILLTAEKEAKISDFGLSRMIAEESDYYTAKTGGRWPVKWYAPESIGHGKFSHKSDVWSFGVTLWEMYTGAAMPYGDLEGHKVYNALVQGQRLEKPAGCPDNVYNLMYSCWNFDPVDRPSFGNILTRLIALQPGRRR